MIVTGDLDAESHAEVRGLIVAGLGEHWGAVDHTLNPDLDDMLTTYASGRTVVARDDHGRIVGTGTIVPRSAAIAEVLRMSVHSDKRRSGVGRLVLTELVATARNWNSETVILETSSAWSEVITFYQNFGFHITHVEEGEFGSDTWFALNLSDPGDEPQRDRTRTADEHHSVAAALLVRDGRVLLCHRHPNRRWYPDVWDTPGGHIAKDETPADALRRELAEELGVTVTLVSPEPWRVLHLAPDLTLNVWVVDQWHGTIENLAPDEHDDLRWFWPSKIDRLDLAYTQMHQLIVDATDRT